ncbi:MAG: hypothetical protein HRF51_05950 [bacterium]|jgi:alpha-L-fucosidase
MSHRNLKIILAISLMGNLFAVYAAIKALEYRRHINDFLFKYTYVVEEFSGRKNFAHANRRLLEEGTNERRVVFLGTQVTAGWELERHFPEIDAVNRGISGQRMAGFLLRFRPDVVELAPRAVVIEFSSYSFRPENSIEELQDYLITLAEIALYHKIEPILSTIIPVGSDFEMEESDDYKIMDSIALFNNWLSNYCQDNKIRLLDFGSAVADSSGFLSDRYRAGHIILNDSGYARISELTGSVLREILNHAD